MISKKIKKPEATELKTMIDGLAGKLPANYTAKMINKFPTRYNKGNVYKIYNTVAKRRLDRQIIKDLQRICN